MIGLTFLFFQLLYLAIFGVIVGSIAKVIYNGQNEPVGFMHTAILGIVGSYVGGGISYMFGSRDVISMSGIALSVVGSIVAMWVYDKYLK